MSTLYLVNLFNDQINDVMYSSGDELPITGSYVLRVPDDVVVRNPTDSADILTQKYASILAFRCLKDHGSVASDATIQLAARLS